MIDELKTTINIQSLIALCRDLSFGRVKPLVDV